MVIVQKSKIKSIKRALRENINVRFFVQPVWDGADVVRELAVVLHLVVVLGRYPETYSLHSILCLFSKNLKYILGSAFVNV